MKNEKLDKAMVDKWEELANGILSKDIPNPYAFNIGFKEGVKWAQSQPMGKDDSFDDFIIKKKENK